MMYFFSTNTLTAIIVAALSRAFAAGRVGICSLLEWLTNGLTEAKKTCWEASICDLDFYVVKLLTAPGVCQWDRAGRNKARWAPVSTGSKASCWAVSSLGSALRFRAEALGVLLGERGSACDLCNAFIWLTTASLQQAGSS